MALDAWKEEIRRLQAQQDALRNAPVEPMYSPEEQDSRVGQNQFLKQWGLLGSLADDEVLNKAGGTYLKQALSDSTEKVDEKGVVDPLKGTRRFFPEYLRQREQERGDKSLESARANYAKAQDQQERDRQRAEDRKELKTLVGGLAGGIGMGNAQHIAYDANGKQVFRPNKGGPLFTYDDQGQPQPFVGKTYDKAAVPAQTQREIATKEAYLDQHKDFQTRYKPEYAGTAPGLAKVEANLGRYVGGPLQETAEWWQEYRNWTIQLRRDLFGTALTAPEKALFDESNIEPGMHPTIISNRMQQQQRVIAMAINKIKGAYAGHAGMEPTPVPPYLPEKAGSQVINTESGLMKSIFGEPAPSPMQSPSPQPKPAPEAKSTPAPATAPAPASTTGWSIKRKD